jgi:hypothetical protein
MHWAVRCVGTITATSQRRCRARSRELRRRFGGAFRPQLELDYIERLLKDYWTTFKLRL